MGLDQTMEILRLFFFFDWCSNSIKDSPGTGFMDPDFSGSDVRTTDIQSPM